MPFYQKTWFMCLMMVIFFPVGLFLLWKYDSRGIKVKAIITVFVLGFVFFANSSDTAKQASETTKQSTVSKKITQVMGVTTEQSNLIEATLKKCGINEIEAISHDNALDNSYGENDKGYRIKVNNDIKNLITYISKDGSIKAIRWAGHNLYKDGKVLGEISNYYLTSTEQFELQNGCEEVIKKRLKAPSTATFADISEWKFYKDKEKIIIESYVDAQNSFGAKIRSQFKITLTPDAKTIKSLILEGKEYM